MNISKYNGDTNDVYSISDNDYSASKDGMPKLRINYEDSSSDDNSDTTQCQQIWI